MIEKTQDYYLQDLKMQAFIGAADDKVKRPAVLIFHSWHGRDDFVIAKAKALAELGYVGIAADMYGNAKLGKDMEENAKLMAPFVENRELIRTRTVAAYEFAQSLSFVDKSKIAAIGFCFGGMCSLDLARTGLPLKGVVSFHGLLESPSKSFSGKINAKILAMTGFDDPWVPVNKVTSFCEEMTALNADWQLLTFGHTKHAFTNPIANDPKSPSLYSPCADKRSWIAMKSFLNEIFS